MKRGGDALTERASASPLHSKNTLGLWFDLALPDRDAGPPVRSVPPILIARKAMLTKPFLLGAPSIFFRCEDLDITDNTFFYRNKHMHGSCCHGTVRNVPNLLPEHAHPSRALQNA